VKGRVHALAAADVAVALAAAVAGGARGELAAADRSALNLLVVVPLAQQLAAAAAAAAATAATHTAGCNVNAGAGARAKTGGSKVCREEGKQRVFVRRGERTGDGIREGRGENIGNGEGAV
jgi:hypothetical protein